MKFFLFAYFLFVFSSRILVYGRPLERCNEAWRYVIQLIVRFCNDIFKLKHLFSFSLYLVGN